MNKNIAGISSGMINMLLFAFAPVIVGLSSLDFFQKLLFSQLFSLVTLAILISFVGLKEFIRFSKSFKVKHYIKLFMVGFLRLGMSLCFFYALSNGPRIENNIITLTWPIFLVVFNVVGGEQNVTKSEIISLILAFIGSSFIVLKGDNFNSFSFSHYTYKYSLLYAILGGFYYFAYKKIKKDVFPSTEEILNNQTILSHLMMVFWQSLVGVILIFIISPFFKFSFAIPNQEVIYMAALGILGYSLPQVFISHSNLNLKASDFAVLRYLNPVICTLYLYFFLGDELFPNTILGTTLIFTCIYMVQVVRNGVLNAQSGAGYFAILFTAYLYFSNGNLKLEHELETYGAIFSIILAFTLSRIHQKLNDERAQLNELNIHMYDVYSYFSSNKQIQVYLYNLIQKIYDFDFYYRTKKIEGLTLEINRRLNHIIENLEESDIEEKQKIKELDLYIGKWLSLKIDKVSIGEKLAIWLLGIVTIFVLAISTGGSYITDLITLLVSTTIFYLCWLVRDYDLNIPNKTFSQVMLNQRSINRIFGVYYLPYKTVLNKDYPKISTDITVVTTTKEWIDFERSFLDLFTFYKSADVNWGKKKEELISSSDRLIKFYDNNAISTNDIKTLKEIIKLVEKAKSPIGETFKKVYSLFMSLKSPLVDVSIEKSSKLSTFIEKILIVIGLCSIFYVLSLKYTGV